MNKKILFFALLLLMGCKKTPYHQEYSLGPLYSIPGEMKEWTMFKPGSYWIYKNETTSELDSSAYKYGPYYEEIPCYNCPVYQHMWYFVASSVFVKFYLYGGADSNAYLELSTRYNGTNNIINYHTLMHPDSSSNSSDYWGTYQCLGKFENFVLNGNTFTNVIGTRLVIKTSFYDETTNTTESWFARNIGLIKFRHQSEKGDTTWSLVKWHTVQ